MITFETRKLLNNSYTPLYLLQPLAEICLSLRLERKIRLIFMRLNIIFANGGAVHLNGGAV